MKTLLIDSNFLCYRAKLTTGFLSYQEIPTGIMFGFLNQLITAAKKVEPNQFIFLWDSKESERKKLLPTYKEKRRENQTEEEKNEWKEAFKEFNNIRANILPSIGFHNNFTQKGYESDDLIAKYLEDKSKREEVYVATNDDDLLQLLDNCHILNLGKDKIITKKIFEKEYEITPQQWAEVKAIAGCKSDNVPGIPGVGEKTAIKYLKSDLKKTSKAYQKIKDNKDLIEFNRDLVVLPFKNTQDVKELLEWDDFSMKKFLRLCRDYNLNSFRKDEKKEMIKNLFS